MKLNKNDKNGNKTQSGTMISVSTKANSKIGTQIKFTINVKTLKLEDIVIKTGISPSCTETVSPSKDENFLKPRRLNAFVNGLVKVKIQNTHKKLSKNP